MIPLQKMNYWTSYKIWYLQFEIMLSWFGTKGAIYSGFMGDLL